MNSENPPASPDKICVKLAMPGITLAFPSGALSWSIMLQRIICRALQDNGILAELTQGELAKAHGLAPTPAYVCGFGNQAMGLFGVTNRMKGLLTVRAGLEDIHLLAHSHIA